VHTASPRVSAFRLRDIAPDQRFEAIVDATEIGTWAFHCHILTHAESAHGMFGMVTVFVVEE
jgi:FtsP/CotA-like multicopper oxidase with cupredoxin domain